MFKGATYLFVLLISIFGYLIYDTFIVVEDSPIVTTENGLVKGRIAYSRDGKLFYQYFAIPYAKPPIENLRFEDPKPPSNWDGIKIVQKFGNECAQLNFAARMTVETEDCLFLNVFTTTVSKDANLPVLVFIHGGLFISGSPNLNGGKYFADENIILVTINYRLAALGFLNTGDGYIRGNMGLKDQIMALKWVQNNIASFGGDPGKVTIMGQSAGSIAVHYHILSPLSKGLFHRGISSSGAALNSWAFQREPRKQAQYFASQLNCSSTNTKDMLTCLKKVPISELLAAHSDTMSGFRDPISLFAPTIEDNYPEAVLPEPLYDLMSSGKANPVPWLVGYNADEGQLFFAMIAKNDTELKIFLENFNKKLPYFIFFAYTKKSEREALAQRIKDFYLNGTEPDGTNAMQICSDIFTDAIFSSGIAESIKLQSQFQLVYPYYYNYHGDIQLADLVIAIKGNYHILLEGFMYFATKWIKNKFFGYTPTIIGATHCDDSPLFFDFSSLGLQIGPDHKDYEMSKSIVKLWADFIRGERDIKFRGKPLLPLDKDSKEIKYLKLDMNPEIINQPHSERLNFWKKNMALEWNVNKKVGENLT